MSTVNGAGADDEPSYIDYETFLSPNFSAPTFANELVLSTNNPTDVSLDLSTPLSRVLFDIQEIDSHIDLLATRSAIPLLEHTENQAAASGRILDKLDGQIQGVNDTYKQLEKQVILKHAEAEEVRDVAAKLWETLNLGRAVGRCLQFGKHLQVQAQGLGNGAPKDAHRILERAAYTILSIREALQDGAGDLNKVHAVRNLRDEIVAPIEKTMIRESDRIVREFSMGSASGTATYAQQEDAKARAVSALSALFLLSPTDLPGGRKWTPSLMLQALEGYLRTALQSSSASMSRSLAALPTLERTLAEVSARCQNIVALEQLLSTTKAPQHPMTSVAHEKEQSKGNLLQPLLAHLETGSLPSYFWRSLAGSLSTRTQEIVHRGGVASRTLRTNRDNVGDAIRECVRKGSQFSSSGGEGKVVKSWERETAVMVRSIVGQLGG